MIGFIYILDETRVVVFDLAPADSTPLGSIPIDPGPTGLAADQFGLAVGGSDTDGFKVTHYSPLASGGTALRALQGPATLLSYPVPLLYAGQEDLLYVLNADFPTNSSYVTVYPRSARGDQAPMWTIKTSAEPALLVPKPCFAFPSGGPAGGLLCVPEGERAISLYLPDASGGPLRTIQGTATGLDGSNLNALAALGDSLYAFGTTFDVNDAEDGFVVNIFDANSGGDVPPTRVIPSGNQDPLMPVTPVDFDVDGLGKIYVLQYAHLGFPSPHPPNPDFSLSIYPASASGPAPRPSFTISGPDAGFSNPLRVAVVSFSPE